MPHIPPELCARCKGYKLLCGLPSCPILERFRAQVGALQLVSGKDVEGSTPPSALVGEAGYPSVNLYFMVPPGRRGEEAAYYDAPSEWARRSEPLSRIVGLRGSMVSGFQRFDVHEPWRLYETELGLAVVSERPVDSEVVLKAPPVPRLRFDGITKPVGPRAPAERVIVGGTPKISSTVERAIWDDALAEEAMWELYRAGVDVYKLQDLLSLGFLGRLRNRKIVPTRWAITAVDDNLSRILRERVRDYSEVNDTEVYMHEYLSNRFLIAIMPGEGSFEWVEIWHPLSFWASQASSPVVWVVREDPLGRTSAMDGGFSAARLAVLEALESMKRKANVLIIREILPSYYAPVGNWHIRESVRTAMSKRPEAVQDKASLAGLISGWAKAEPKYILNNSLLLGVVRRQAKLTEFI
ncbi:MAG: Nre family DNA repair protein [Acidilobus sp.]